MAETRVSLPQIRIAFFDPRDMRDFDNLVALLLERLCWPKEPDVPSFLDWARLANGSSFDFSVRKVVRKPAEARLVYNRDEIEFYGMHYPGHSLEMSLVGKIPNGVSAEMYLQNVASRLACHLMPNRQCTVEYWPQGLQYHLTVTAK
jgi:hypothetical protein